MFECLDWISEFQNGDILSDELSDFAEESVGRKCVALKWWGGRGLALDVELYGLCELVVENGIGYAVVGTDKILTVVLNDNEREYGIDIDDMDGVLGKSEASVFDDESGGNGVEGSDLVGDINNSDVRNLGIKTSFDHSGKEVFGTPIGCQCDNGFVHC